MQKIYRVNKGDLESSSVYCTIDGVLTEVVYKISEGYVDELGNEYFDYSRLKVTSKDRLNQQKSLQSSANLQSVFTEREETTTTTAQSGTVTTTTTKQINPVCIFNFNHKVYDTSGAVSKWVSSYNSSVLTQSTTANQPSLGKYGKGKGGFTPIYFNTEQSDFMSLDSAITVTGDFTMFFYIEPIGIPVNKYFRLLGKRDDNNMFLSIGEQGNESYKLSFDGSTSSSLAADQLYWIPSSKKLLITIQRSGTTLYVRENGTEIDSVSVSANDFTFDQVGKLGNNTNYFFNGSIYHFSVFDGYFKNNLVKIENSIIKSINQAKGV